MSNKMKGKKKAIIRILMSVLMACAFALVVPEAGKANAVAGKPMAVLDEESNTLTFYYDENHTAGVNAWEIPTIFEPFDGDDKIWCYKYGKINHIVIDESFKNYKPVSTAYWFSQLSNVTDIKGLSNIDTSNVRIMDGMFYCCSSLDSIDLSGFNTSNVTSMERMFYHCDMLTKLNVSSFNTEKVKNMNYMFAYLSELTSLNISNFKTPDLENVSGMFSGCSKLTSLNLGKLDTADVTSFGSMFEGCQALTKLDVSGLNTEKAEVLSRMFYGCAGLTSLNLSSFNTANVKLMNGLFGGCKKLSSINLSGLKTDKVTDMSGMFSECISLKNIDLSRLNTAKVEKMNSMFSNSGLTSLDLSGFSTQSVRNMSFMFNGCSGLKSIKFGNLLDTSNVTTMQFMFQNCSSLTGLDLRLFNTEKVENMLCMFNGCSSLTDLDLSSFNTQKVKETSMLFNNCSALISIYVSDMFRLNQVPETYKMFRGCTALIGGCGTKYNISEISASYAKIDGGENVPGYFTAQRELLGIIRQPVSAKVNEGSVASFSLTAKGYKVTYLWQYKKKGDKVWTDWSTKTTPDITVAYESSRDGMSLRCGITEGENTIYSDEVTLTYEDAPVVTEQPVSTTVDVGNMASFSLTAKGSKVTYLWQYKKKGAKDWTDWTTKTKAAITVAYEEDRNGMSLRCRLKDQKGNVVYSDVVTLTYKDGPIVTEQPVSTTVKKDSIASFSLKATGKKLTYLWQYRKKGTQVWTSWNSKNKADITVAYEDSRDGIRLRCRIMDGDGNITYSDIVTLNYSK